MMQKIFFLLILNFVTFSSYSKENINSKKNTAKAVVTGVTSIMSLKLSIEMLELIYNHWDQTARDELLDKYLVFQLLSASAALAYVSGKTFFASIEYIKSSFKNATERKT